VECSLVTSVAQATPGTSLGHIIEVSGFGKVSLTEVTVDRAFHLTMVGVDAGKNGWWKFADDGANGHTHT
jgi:hypothetical protein